jgi:hypothetical protein
MNEGVEERGLGRGEDGMLEEKRRGGREDQKRKRRRV